MKPTTNKVYRSTLFTDLLVIFIPFIFKQQIKILEHPTVVAWEGYYDLLAIEKKAIHVMIPDYYI